MNTFYCEQTGLGIEWGSMLSNVVSNVAKQLPDVGLKLITTVAQAKLAEKLGPKPEKSSKGGGGGGGGGEPAPAPAPTVPMMPMYRPPAQPSKALPSWVLPVSIVGGLALVGGVAFLALRRKG